ncbi:MAG: 2-hydroxyacyl-CoA dehydratase [Candidatus Aegiribacteria sp.]|nr:2-hydroxyacyl-CoA dehydratase [Candidatus Aegiribacteria sp.]
MIKRLTQSELREMWTDLGMNLELHDQLLESSSRIFKKTHLWQKKRPAAMALFDRALHDSHGQRVAEILDYRNNGGKSLGTFCIYVPDEIALAASVLTIPLCGGSGWTVDYADKMLPRDICPLVRSTFGMAISGTCPYKTLKEYPLGETTCDAKKKTWDLFGIPSMEVPQKKNKEDKALWISEVKKFMGDMEKISGVQVTAENLRESIRKCNRKRTVLQKISEYRKLRKPPISGLDALLVSQVALNMDIDSFINAGKELITELATRVEKGISAYDNDGVRVLFAGTPSPMGYAKVHWAAETSGLQIVADESCTGIRYYRDQIQEDLDTLDEMIEAVAERYFKIDCPCFSPNKERFDNIINVIEEFQVEAVVHNILQFCHGFNIEAGALDNMLKDNDIPSLKIVCDYSEEDGEQIKVRMEAFREITESNRNPEAE